MLTIRYRSFPRCAVGVVTALVLSCVAVAGTARSATAALTAVIQVTGTADEVTVNGVCSLREAILAANLDQAVDTCAAGAPTDEIVLPAGTYQLTIPGQAENAGATGDLDVTSNTVITGAGSVIDAGGIDRAIEILPGADVKITGVTIQSGNLQASDVDVSGAGTTGGGIYNNGRLSLVDSIVTANSVDQNEFGGAAGGGIANDGELTLVHTQISANRLGNILPDGAGGGVLNGGTLTAIDSVISGNFAWNAGGGIYNVGTAVIVGSTVSGNSTGCFECTGRGGGIYNGASLQVTNSTISGNSSGSGDYGGTASGGGIRNDGTAQLISVTLANNEARKSCDTHCFGDPETDGGGTSNSGSISITDTIMSGNTATVTQSEPFGGGSVTTPSDCAGGLTSQGYNLIGNSAGCSVVGSTGDLLDVDPFLGPLQDNGGPSGESPAGALTTLTQDLGAGSPAIDAGNPGLPGSGGSACPDTDQRGVPRPVDGNSDGIATCDIGAVETGSPDNTPSLDSNSNAVSYDGWTGVTDPLAFGGGYRTAASAGRTIFFEATRDARTRSIAVMVYRGPDQGRAEVTIDGRHRRTIDLYAKMPSYQTIAFRLRPAPEHEKEKEQGHATTASTEITAEIKVTVLGTKQRHSTGTAVRIDGFTLAGTTYDDTSNNVRYGAWSGTDDALAVGGGYRSAATQGTVAFDVRGPSFTWITARGPGYGIARVTVDGTARGDVDLFASQQQWRARQVFSGLRPGLHHVEITALGAKNPSSQGTAVVFDAVRFG